MPTSARPRHVLAVVRLALATWLLSLGVALAAPWLNTSGVQAICTSAGIKYVALPDSGTPPNFATQDCPLCGAGPALPATPVAITLRALAAAAPRPATLAAPRAAALPAPWQARAPPAFTI